ANSTQPPPVLSALWACTCAGLTNDTATTRVRELTTTLKRRVLVGFNSSIRRRPAYREPCHLPEAAARGTSEDGAEGVGAAARRNAATARVRRACCSTRTGSSPPWPRASATPKARSRATRAATHTRRRASRHSTTA